MTTKFSGAITRETDLVLHDRKAIVSLESVDNQLVLRLRPSGCRTGWYMVLDDYVARCNIQDRDSTKWIKDPINTQGFR